MKIDASYFFALMIGGTIYLVLELRKLIRIDKEQNARLKKIIDLEKRQLDRYKTDQIVCDFNLIPTDAVIKELLHLSQFMDEGERFLLHNFHHISRNVNDWIILPTKHVLDWSIYPNLELYNNNERPIMISKVKGLITIKSAVWKTLAFTPISNEKENA